MKKLPQRAKSLLFEAYRRDDMRTSVDRETPLNRRLLGLGSRSAYKVAIDLGLMEFVLLPPPRCKGWLHLTDLGVRWMWELRHEFEETLQVLKKNPNYLASHASQFSLASMA